MMPQLLNVTNPLCYTVSWACGYDEPHGEDTPQHALSPADPSLQVAVKLREALLCYCQNMIQTGNESDKKSCCRVMYNVQTIKLYVVNQYLL